jgi:CheY-like chemotaxis protein
MPELDGFAATQEIRQRESQLSSADNQSSKVKDTFAPQPAIESQQPVIRPIPIIAMTASLLEEDRKKCLATGMNDFLSKPLRPNELEHILNRWVKQAPVPTQEAA